jgi:type IV pilus assembly protein PilQ
MAITLRYLAVSIFSSAANRFTNLEISALEADGKGKLYQVPVVTADQSNHRTGTELPYRYNLRCYFSCVG